MGQLFISHSSIDKDIAQNLIDFFVLGMGIPRKEIFCTSQSGTLVSGDLFIERIRENLNGCQLIVCILSPNYLRSKFCLAEMGAAWLQTGKIIPLLVPPLRYEDLNDTPLLGLQMSYIDDEDKLFNLYDLFGNLGIIQNRQSAEFSRQMKKFIRTLNDTKFIEPDESGYYHVKIETVRTTPSSFRCYKLAQPLKLHENMVSGETHWLFYRTGMYEDLSVGDTVKILVSSTELRNFPDLKNARNIYPDDLKKINS